MVFAELFVGDIRLFAREIGGLQNFLAQPLVAAGSREHTAHEMVAAVGVGKRVKRIVGVNAEFVGRNEDRPGRTERDIAAARADCSCADRSSGVIARTSHDLHGFRQSQCLRSFLGQRANDLEAFKQLRHLAFRNAADVQHFLRPALVCNIQQKHAGGVGVIAAMHTRQFIVDIIFWKHDLCDLFEVLRLILAHPEKLRCRKARESNVCRQRRKPFLANRVIEVVNLFKGSAVVPEDCRADNAVLCVQRNKPVHLAACADAHDLRRVEAPQQLRNAGHDRVPPVLRPLLRPARMREDQGIFPCDFVLNRTVLSDKQQLAGGRAEINADK